MASGAVSVLGFPSDVLGIGFPVSREAVIAKQEEFPKETPRRRWGLSEDVGDSFGYDLGGALRFGPWILLQDGEYGVFVKLLDLHHVDR